MTDKRIVVVKLGWVLVGDYEKKDNVVHLTNASVVRRWGTSKGIGELALKGPRPETVLDPCGIAEIPDIAVLMTLSCSQKGWAT